MTSTAKVLQFPHAGIARDMDYRKAYIPSEGVAFATPFALNVIGECAFTGRLRGGSRPALRLLSGVTPSTLGEWQWPNGAAIAWNDSYEMVYKTFGETITAPFGKTLKQHETFDISVSKGELPKDCKVMAFYRARLVVAKDTVWYASRQGDVTDFDFGADAEDVGRAAAGNVAKAATEGEEITALIAPTDSFLLVSTARRLKMLTGEPTSGGFSTVSEHVGVISKDAWCYDGSIVWFMGSRGLYAFSPGEGFAKLASSRLPEDLAGMTAATLVYDPARNGIHLILTRDDKRFDWFYDIENNAFWQLAYDSSLAPSNGGTAIVNGRNRAVFLCADGNWRYWDDDTADEGVTYPSYVAIGPLRASGRDDMDGMLAELNATIGKGSSPLKIKIFTAKTPEEAVEKASSFMSVRADGEVVVHGGYNHVVRTRVRGAWVVFVLYSDGGQWSYESMTAICKMFGRLR